MYVTQTIWLWHKSFRQRHKRSFCYDDNCLPNHLHCDYSCETLVSSRAIPPFLLWTDRCFQCFWERTRTVGYPKLQLHLKGEDTIFEATWVLQALGNYVEWSCLCESCFRTDSLTLAHCWTHEFCEDIPETYSDTLFLIFQTIELLLMWNWML